jgi:hypothetical protein
MQERRCQSSLNRFRAALARTPVSNICLLVPACQENTEGRKAMYPLPVRSSVINEYLQDETTVTERE